MRVVFYVLFLLFLTVLPPQVLAGQALLDTQPVLENAIKGSAAAGRAARQWDAKKQGLIHELQNLELQAQWAVFQNQKLDRMITAQAREIDQLKDQLEKAQLSRKNLAPLMEVVYARLEAGVENDLPFLPEERRRRLAFLRQRFDDASASPADKLSALIEAVQVEVNYGLTAQAYDTLFVQDDVEYQSTCLQVGRIGFFQITANNGAAFRFNRQARQWEALPHDQIPALVKAVDIVRKKRVAQIVDLPLGFFKDLEAKAVAPGSVDDIAVAPKDKGGPS